MFLLQQDFFRPVRSPLPQSETPRSLSEAKEKRPPATPVTPALEQSEDKNFLIIRKEGPLSLRILSSRTDDIRYASTLSDLEVELGVYDVVWQNEQSMSNMPKGYNDPLYEFAVQPCVLSQMPDGVHGESRSCGMSLV